MTSPLHVGFLTAEYPPGPCGGIGDQYPNPGLRAGPTRTSRDRPMRERARSRITKTASRCADECISEYRRSAGPSAGWRSSMR